MNFEHIFNLIKVHYRALKSSRRLASSPVISAVFPLIDQSIAELQKGNLQKSLNLILTAHEKVINTKLDTNEIFTILALINLINNRLQKRNFKTACQDRS